MIIILLDFDDFFFGSVAVNREHNFSFINNALRVNEADIEFSGEFVFNSHGIVKITYKEWFDDVCLLFW